MLNHDECFFHVLMIHNQVLNLYAFLKTRLHHQQLGLLDNRGKHSKQWTYFPNISYFQLLLYDCYIVVVFNCSRSKLLCYTSITAIQLINKSYKIRLENLSPSKSWMLTLRMYLYVISNSYSFFYHNVCRAKVMRNRHTLTCWTRKACGHADLVGICAVVTRYGIDAYVSTWTVMSHGTYPTVPLLLTCAVCRFVSVWIVAINAGYTPMTGCTIPWK